MRRPGWLFGVLAALCSWWPGTAVADSTSALWLEAGVRADLGPRTTLSFSQHVRFDQDVSRVGAVMPEVGGEVDVSKWLELGIGYRYEYTRHGDDLESGHRLNADAGIEAELGALELGYRLRLQQQVGDTGSRRLRSRVAGELDLDAGWRPFLSGELFQDIGGRSTGWVKTRFTLGVETEIRERDVQAFYRVDVPKDHMEPIVHIVGLGWRTKL